MYKSIDLFYEPRTIIMPKIDAPKGEPEMSEFESAFFCGIIKKFKPYKIVEVGIAGGGTTAIVLECMELLNLPYEMHSIDYLELFYLDKTKPSGYLGERAKKYVNNANLKFWLGTIAPDCIDEIGNEIDLLILDTAHVLPGEFLDFLALFPYLSKDAVVVLHDLANNCVAINEPKSKFRERANATKLLFDSVCADKYFMFDESAQRRKGFANIGAFQLTENTRQSLANVVSALSNTWYYFPEDKQWDSYAGKIEECLHDDEESKKIWEGVVQINRLNLNAPDEPIKIGIIIYRRIKQIVKNVKHALYLTKKKLFTL